MNHPGSAAECAQRGARVSTPVRTAWQSLRRSGLVAPELPPILFVATANSTGFWWGLGSGITALICVAVMARRQRWSGSTVVGGAIGLTIAATIARLTGVATGGLLADICLDLTLGAVLAGSVAVRRPLFAGLWSAVRHQPLLRDADRRARAVYNLTTMTAAVALEIRGVALGVVYLNDEPVAWLLVVKVALGMPVTLLVIAAAYAAGGIDDANHLANDSSTITADDQWD